MGVIKDFLPKENRNKGGPKEGSPQLSSPIGFAKFLTSIYSFNGGGLITLKNHRKGGRMEAYVGLWDQISPRGRAPQGLPPKRYYSGDFGVLNNLGGPQIRLLNWAKKVFPKENFTPVNLNWVGDFPFGLGESPSFAKVHDIVGL